MPRLQDFLFALLAVALALLLALQFRIAIFGLVGAFLCGSIYLFAGMFPSRQERFWDRAFVSVFLASVMSSLVLILPGTFGVNQRQMQDTVIALAAVLPVIALCFEIVRTPRVLQTLLRLLGVPR